jgi:hypothetical protein
VPPAPPAAETAVTLSDFTAPPPWARAKCPSCGSGGWNPQGAPCNICVGLSKYDMSKIKLNGPRMWEPFGAVPVEASPPPAPAQNVGTCAEVPTIRITPPAPKQGLLALLGKKAPPAAAAPVVPVPPAQAEAPPPAPPPAATERTEPATAVPTPPEAPKPNRRPGRPAGSGKAQVTVETTAEALGPVTFTLVLGAIPVSAGCRVIDASKLLQAVEVQLAEAMGAKGGYYSIGTWDRRDALARSIRAVIEAHIPAGSIVFATSTDPEIEHLAERLAPFASTLIRAVR